MTMTPFTCDTFAEHLADYLERDASPATRAAMEAHATGCNDCSALLADLAAIRVEAAALPVLAPSRDLWSGIADRIETPVLALAASGGTAVRVQRRRWWKHPALLAAGLVGITAGVTHYATREAYEDRAGSQVVVTTQPPMADSGVAVEAPTQVAEAGDAVAAPRESGVPASASVRPTPSVTPRSANAPRNTAVRMVSASAPSADAYRPGELAALDSLYHREILRLRQVLGERRDQLDSTTVAVLERNMTVIDGAIAECRAALAKDPASRFLNRQLNDALETKIELLRTAATMPVGS